MKRVRHETSPTAALAIIKSQVFVTARGGEDGCMNVEIIEHENGHTPIELANKGVSLFFEWDGQVQKKSDELKISTSLYHADILIDEMPFRGMLAVGTGLGLTGSTATLRLVEVEFDDEFKDFELENREIIEENIRKRPQIKVVMPTGALYREEYWEFYGN